MNAIVPSPVIKSAETKVVDKVSVSRIINLYNQLWHIDVSRFFKNIDELEVRECQKTGYRFYYPFSVVGDDKFYEHLHLSGGYYRPWSYDHQLALDTINKDQAVLEIGCGSGMLLERIHEKTTNLHGLEFHEAAVNKCRSKGFSASTDSIEIHALTKANFYDVVCAMQVLEHVTDVDSFLRNTVSVLKPGGKLVIGVPNNEPYFRRFDKYEMMNLPPHHIGLWNPKAFRSIQDIFGIRIEKIFTTGEARVLVDAYLRARHWLGIQAQMPHHSMGEKIKMAVLGTVTVPMSLVKKLSGGIPGGYLGVVFIKK